MVFAIVVKIVTEIALPAAGMVVELQDSEVLFAGATPALPIVALGLSMDPGIAVLYVSSVQMVAVVR